MKNAAFLILIFLLFKVDAQLLTHANEGQTLARADSLYGLGSYAHAINYYANDSSVASQLQIARAYNAIGNYEKAILTYDHIVAKIPSVAIAKFELGKLYYKINKLDHAVDLFLDLIQDDTNNPEYFYYMGQSLAGLDNSKEGIRYLKSAVEIDSTHLRSLYQLGKYYVIKRERDSVLMYVDKGLRFYENDASLLNWKALAYFNNNEYRKALPLFEHLVTLGEKKQFIYEKLAYCYFKTWEFEKAKNTYKIVLDIDANNPEVHFNLGQVFWKDRQLDSARFYIKKSIELQIPILNKEYDALAQLSRQEDDLKSALDYYKLAYAEDKTDFIAFYNICTVADQFYQDPKLKLEYYQRFIEKFGTKRPYCSDFAQKRIKELKEEIHFAKD